jgi:histone deacetylase 1/2
VFLINHLPTSVLGYKSPHEVVFGFAPTYDSLRVFGCFCYPLLAPFGRSKLDFKSTRCVFLGYSTNHKGYLYLEPQAHHFYISHHVKFNEFQFPYKYMQQPDTHASQLFKIKALPRLLKTVAEKSIAPALQVSHHDPITIVQDAEPVQEESASQPATSASLSSSTTADITPVPPAISLTSAPAP